VKTKVSFKLIALRYMSLLLRERGNNLYSYRYVNGLDLYYMLLRVRAILVLQNHIISICMLYVKHQSIPQQM
jgi:hypothetical protein